MQKLWLKKNEDRRIRAGHLWVFSNEVDTAKSPLTAFAPGEAASLHDWRGVCLGSVCVSPAALICARLHSRKAGVELDEALIHTRLQNALALRQSLFHEPWYRLCHSEGDFLPGLVVDRYGDHLTLQIGTAGMERRKESIVAALSALLGHTSLYFDNDLGVRGLENLSRQPESRGNLPESLVVPENGCHFRVPVAGGQKTGWFYDQRCNRQDFARHAQGQDVLDIFSYAGGFGVYAAAAGARFVTFLDASAPALELARHNAAANAPNLAAADAISSLCGDAFQLLAELAAQGRRFGLISLDPPAFIKRRKDMAQGLAAYRKVNLLAMRLLRPGGILVSSSCSHHLTAEALRTCVAQAAARLGLHGRLLGSGSQGPDHPVHASMPETAYLKCVTLQAS